MRRKIGRKRDPVATELTWEEKNPTDYRYRSSKAIERLEKWVNSEKREQDGHEGDD